MVCDINLPHPAFDTVEEARFDCAHRPECVGLVDHTRKNGRVGLCDTNSKFFAGNGEYSKVCVERKPDHLNRPESSVLLQVHEAERTKRGAVKWEKKQDVLCEGERAWSDTLDSAKAVCVSRQDCIGVVDYSAHEGMFNICTHSTPFKRASSVHANWHVHSVLIKH
jgi:hypothetical protein